jgi:hypothetical protein
MESTNLADDDPLELDPQKSEAGHPSWSQTSKEEIHHLIKAGIILCGFNQSTLRGSGAFENHPNEW